MLTPMPSLLTRREFFLIAFILVILLSLYRRELNALRLVPQRSLFQYDDSSDPEFAWEAAQIPSSRAERWRTRVTWEFGEAPTTTIVSHVPGWTILDNLFLFNGTVFIVANDSESIPERDHIISTGIKLTNEPEAIAARVPTDRELRVITAEEAQEIFGSGADLIDGATWIINDPPQFMAHYYHWAAELFFGFWRTYASLDQSISADGLTLLPALRRVWFVHADAHHWRDYASLNQWVLRSVFPSLTSEYSADWQDRAEMGRPLMLDRVIFSDRIATMKGDIFPTVRRTAAEALALPGSDYWWSLVRGAVTKFSGLAKHSDVNAVDGKSDGKFVITYVSRQEWGRRKLLPDHHDKLVEELYKLRDLYGVEVNVVSMHKLSHAEQFRLAARSTIMMGVHGNGLTALLWMKPSPRSTVIEFFFPEGFTHDYAFPARALGMKHYGVWNDKTFTYPDMPRINHPEGFQGNSIPLNGEVVAKLCMERLKLGGATTPKAADS